MGEGEAVEKETYRSVIVPFWTANEAAIKNSINHEIRQPSIGKAKKNDKDTARNRDDDERK